MAASPARNREGLKKAKEGAARSCGKRNGGEDELPHGTSFDSEVFFRKKHHGGQEIHRQGLLGI